MRKPGQLIRIGSFRILTTLKKYTHKPHTFFYVPQNTHITAFHTKIILKSNNAYKNHHTNPYTNFLRNKDTQETFSLI